MWWTEKWHTVLRPFIYLFLFFSQNLYQYDTVCVNERCSYIRLNNSLSFHRGMKMFALIKITKEVFFLSFHRKNKNKNTTSNKTKHDITKHNLSYLLHIHFVDYHLNELFQGGQKHREKEEHRNYHWTKKEKKNTKITNSPSSQFFLSSIFINFCAS